MNRISPRAPIALVAVMLGVPSLSAACGSTHGFTGAQDAAARDVVVSADHVSSDASIPADRAAPPRADAEISTFCVAQNARIVACSGANDEADPPARIGAFWDGEKCVSHVVTNCNGSDCLAYTGPDALHLCTAAHVSCAPSLCRVTGGRWDSLGTCATTYRCGVLPADDCAGPTRPLCNCGPGKRFDEARGCVVDPTCTAADLCRATNGGWLEANSTGCLPCDSCAGICTAICRPIVTSMCDCGSMARFDPTNGCVMHHDCDEAQQQRICESQRGRWIDRGCCDLVDECGVFRVPGCNLDCTQPPTCACPMGQKWTGRGCVPARCDRREVNGRCNTTSQCKSNLECTCGLCDFPRCAMDLCF